MAEGIVVVVGALPRFYASSGLACVERGRVPGGSIAGLFKEVDLPVEPRVEFIFSCALRFRLRLLETTDNKEWWVCLNITPM
eukprot:CAMPEP_0113881860 /NCGR_PEP_ID=MMETSP0780_2-20120614/8619_1 /TAXON_ID=652834 /ORGANISM="Palpitomonas bilix" /LENGTH=81 /DNA_ID=CAMNT_0000868781 /DNA_START=297 /DNA_END=543 /DNA_ORIENTATION=- /assembly_acc=CAM_ASM_000599